MPAPPTFSQALERANQGLPAGVSLAFRPRMKGGAYSPTPYRVVVGERQVAASATLTGAIFKAMALAAKPQLRRQPQLPFQEPLF